MRQTTGENEWLSDRLSKGDAGNLSKVARTVDAFQDRRLVALRKHVERFTIPKSGDPFAPYPRSVGAGFRFSCMSNPVTPDS